MWGGDFHHQGFTLSELGPGLCSLEGNPPFDKIFKGAAYFLHRVKRGKIKAKQCSGSVPFSSGSGFTFFLKTCPQVHHLQSKKLNVLKFCVKLICCRHYFSPNTFIRRGKDQETYEKYTLQSKEEQRSINWRILIVLYCRILTVVYFLYYIYNAPFFGSLFFIRFHLTVYYSYIR